MAISANKPPRLLRLNEVKVDLKRLFLKMTEAVTVPALLTPQATGRAPRPD